MENSGDGIFLLTVGKVVAGYKVHKNEDGVDKWTLLGKRDPQTAQMFYPVFNTDPIKQGDKLVRHFLNLQQKNVHVKQYQKIDTSLPSVLIAFKRQL